MTDHNAVDTALARVALAAFLEDMGGLDFLAMDDEALVAFARRNQLSRDDIQATWNELERRDLVLHDRVLEAMWPGIHAKQHT